MCKLSLFIGVSTPFSLKIPLLIFLNMQEFLKIFRFCSKVTIDLSLLIVTNYNFLDLLDVENEE